MPSTLAAADAVTQHMERSLRTVGLDITNLLRSFDLQTVGLLGLLLLVGIILLDVFGKGSGHNVFQGSGGTYGSYGRTGVFDSTTTSHLKPSARTSRSLETMTQILESLTHAAKRYEAHDTRTEDQPEHTQQHLN